MTFRDTAFKWPYAAATLAYCAAIFYLSHQSSLPDTTLGGRIPFADKIAHAIVYAGLAATVSFGIRRSNRRASPAVQYYAPIAFAFVYGITDEIHQLFVPNRGFELLDIAANLAGAVAVQLILCYGIWKIGPILDSSQSPANQEPAGDEKPL